MVVQWRALLVVSAALVICGCAPIRVAEVDIQLGTLIDPDSGFYAYTTALPKNDPTKLLVTYSSEATIEGRKTINSPNSANVYPLLAYSPPRIYVRPDFLKQKIRLNVSDPLPPESVHTFGYFKKSLRNTEFAETELDQITESEIGGLSWAILEQKNVELIREEISRFARYAASYGADAVVDVTVYFIGDCSSCRESGLFVKGTAVAFVE